MNSRPLAESENPTDGEALTPGHLLIGSHIKALPERNSLSTSNCQIGFLRRYRHISYLKEQFWHMWLRDYVLNEQRRSKWLSQQNNIEPGTLVMIHEDNIPPRKWLIGRITEAIKGQDGKVRVAMIKTASGFCKRPIHKLAPLPFQQRDSQPD